ncbi:MAG: hypothetical protein ACOC5F_04260 [Candidatus Aminicenantaceae bacterium]
MHIPKKNLIKTHNHRPHHAFSVQKRRGKKQREIRSCGKRRKKTRPLWKTTLYFTVMVAILVFIALVVIMATIKGLFYGYFFS